MLGLAVAHVRVLGPQALDRRVAAARGRGDGGAHELRRHHRGVGLLRHAVQVADPERVHVAAHHDRVVGPRQLLHQPPPCGRVAVPTVGPKACPGPGPAVDGRHHVGLRQHVPGHAPAPELALQPGLLLRSEERALGVLEAGAGLVDLAAAGEPRLVAGRLGAVLPAVGHEDPGQPAEALPGVEAGVARQGHLRAPQRHVLVVGLVGRGAPGHEPVARVPVLRQLAGVVVVDLVVVPGHQPRAGGVGGLQVRVGAVQRVPAAVVLEGHHLGGVGVVPHLVAAPGGLVDVVAHVQAQVQVAAGGVAVGREPALLPVRAGADREAQPLRRGVGPRRRAGAPHRAGEAALPEAVEVPALGLEPVDLDVQRVGLVGPRPGHARADHAREALVVGHLPLHGDGDRRQASARRHVGSEARPEHDVLGQRVARSHPQGEGIAPDQLRGGVQPQRRKAPGAGGRQGRPSDEAPPRARLPHAALPPRPARHGGRKCVEGPLRGPRGNGPV